MQATFSKTELLQDINEPTLDFIQYCEKNEDWVSVDLDDKIDNWDGRHVSEVIKQIAKLDMLDISDTSMYISMSSSIALANFIFQNKPEFAKWVNENIDHESASVLIQRLNVIERKKQLSNILSPRNLSDILEAIKKWQTIKAAK